MRIYLDGEDVSKAILNAGMKLRLEDCWMLKFNQIANELTEKIHRQLRADLARFTEETCQ